MKKSKVIFVAFVMTFALVGGLFVSCSNSSDDSDVIAAYQLAAAQAQKDSETLYNMSVSIRLHDNSLSEGYVYESLSKRKLNSDKTKICMTFMATPESGYTFVSSGVTVTADNNSINPTFGSPDSSGVVTISIEVPTGTKSVKFVGNNIFQPNS